MIIEASQENIKDVVAKLKPKLRSDHLVLLQGDLASGKTTLVKEFVKSLNIDEVVTSPTFSLQQIYQNDTNTIYHYDLYNKTIEEFMALGLIEEFEHSGLHFIEWADDRLKEILVEFGYDVITINIEKIDNTNDKRKYIIN
jgi:tRNA threonylcarbamoyladenosine biosynthesis protein TsaE